MSPKHRQGGITLVVALVMLAVLTLIVASAIRFGNINLKITGNAQSETEANAAAQVGMETMVLAVSNASNISAVQAQTVTHSTGAVTYTVALAKPVCMFNKPVNTQKVDFNDPKNQACFDSGGATDCVRDPQGRLLCATNGCKDQQWDVQAAVDDNKSGTKVTVLQGLSVRVGAEVACP
jgi:hypothetical protein